MFDIPIVLFIFRRTTTLAPILERIREIKPEKMYIIADGGRTPEEKKQCDATRAYVESLIDWDCNVVKNYAKDNRGVYSNIGEGAKWVLSQEKNAIFLEDDNLPEKSFFNYCRELLIKYQENDDILWICGTNYLGKYSCQNSYMFTKHMLPCGWASWANKFLKYYDGELKEINDKQKMRQFKKSYYIKGAKSGKLYRSHLYQLKRTKYLINEKKNESSWDYQMNFSVRANNKFGISPSVNQIKNIGVDNFSTHGGNNINLVNSHCGMESFNLEFPLKHPASIEIDLGYEKLINKKLKPSFWAGYGHMLLFPIKKILKLNKYDSLKLYIKGRKEIGKNSK